MSQATKDVHQREQPRTGPRILSLDGGGVRGLSSLIVLQEVMTKVQLQGNLDEVPYPCAYFDLICGTSTGGLIALMLGRLRMVYLHTNLSHLLVSSRMYRTICSSFSASIRKAITHDTSRHAIRCQPPGERIQKDCGISFESEFRTCRGWERRHRTPGGSSRGEML